MLVKLILGYVPLISEKQLSFSTGSVCSVPVDKLFHFRSVNGYGWPRWLTVADDQNTNG